MNASQVGLVSLGVAGVFGLGLWVGARKSGGDEAVGKIEHEEVARQRSRAREGEEFKNRLDQRGEAPGEDARVLLRLRDARNKEGGEKRVAMMAALEETQRMPLSGKILREFEGILKEGDDEMSGYLISVVEQREDRVAVDFLLKTAGMEDELLAEKARVALEAIGGQVFDDVAAAEAFFKTWQPNPDRQKLFGGSQETGEFGGENEPPRGPMKR